MSDPHHHDRHHHGHHHEHHGDGDQRSNLSFEQKLVKRLEHWTTHNQDHADTYRQWSELAAGKGMPAVGALLAEAAEATRAISRKLEEAIRKVPNE
jgi:hypothetical protein